MENSRISKTRIKIVQGDRNISFHLRTGNVHQVMFLGLFALKSECPGFLLRSLVNSKKIKILISHLKFVFNYKAN
jgi:hypothetical protein